MKNKIESEHERISKLEEQIPTLVNRVDAVSFRLSDTLTKVAHLSVPAFPSLVPFGAAGIFGCPINTSGFESAGAQAGEAVVTMEDTLETLGLDLEELLADPGSNISDEEKAAQTTARQQIGKALQDAREAKKKVAGAATAAKKFGAARQHVVAAEESFNEAERMLREFDRGRAGNPPQNLNFFQKSDKLRAAHQKIKEDVDKLKDALAAITA